MTLSKPMKDSPIESNETWMEATPIESTETRMKATSIESTEMKGVTEVGNENYDTPATAEKLKASNFSALFLKIGSWEVIFLFEMDYDECFQLIFFLSVIEKLY